MSSISKCKKYIKDNNGKILVLSFEKRINHMLSKNGASIQDYLRNYRIEKVDGFEDLEDHPWRIH